MEQIPALLNFFDFAINEQCHEYNECDSLMPFISANKPVFNAEYDTKYVNNISGARNDLCEDSSRRRFKTLILPIELDDSFRYSCN
jgi:hypothetical protein